jgi:hypothetical protein
MLGYRKCNVDYCTDCEPTTTMPTKQTEHNLASDANTAAIGTPSTPLPSLAEVPGSSTNGHLSTAPFTPTHYPQLGMRVCLSPAGLDVSDNYS